MGSSGLLAWFNLGRQSSVGRYLHGTGDVIYGTGDVLGIGISFRLHQVLLIIKKLAIDVFTVLMHGSLQHGWPVSSGVVNFWSGSGSGSIFRSGSGSGSNF